MRHHAKGRSTFFAALVVAGALLLSRSARSYDPTSSNLNLGDTINATQFPGSQVVLWLDPDVGAFTDTAFTTPCTNNTTVGGWRDQSPVGNDVTQATSGSRPTYLTNTLNGHSVVKFTGDGHSSGQSLATGISDLTSDQNWWGVVVCSDGSVTWATRGGDSTNYYIPFSWNGNESGTGGAEFLPYGGNTTTSPNNSGGNFSWVVGGGFNSGVRSQTSAQHSAPATGSYHVFTASSGARPDIRWDGASINPNLRFSNFGGSGGPTNGGNGVIDVGTTGSGFGSRFFNGNIAFLVVGLGIGDVVQIHRLEKYLGVRFNITVS